MTNPNKQHEPSTVFTKHFHIFAVSKQGRGPAYTLDDDKYEELVQAAKFAAQLVDSAMEFLERAGAGRKTSDRLLADDGKLSDLGMIADHFNLIRALQYQGDDNAFVTGQWSLKADFKPSVPDASVVTLYDTVMRCLQLTSKGLRGGIKLRGLDRSETARRTAGMVRTRSTHWRGGQQISDKFHPDAIFRSKGGLFGKQQKSHVIPALTDDKLFNHEDAQVLSDIHVNYEQIATWRGIVTDLSNTDGTLSWTIVHEATHKFARTRDVNDAYRIGECRQLHWHSALRNASHYERLAGIDLGKARGQSQFRVVNLIRDSQ
jgi:hypothetical protein